MRSVLAGLLAAVVLGGGAVALHRSTVSTPPAVGRLAYVAGGHLFILAPGAAPIEVPARSADTCAASPAWSADGEWIAYLQYACPHPDHSVPAGETLAVVRANGRDGRVFADWAGSVFADDFSWSASGHRLAVAPRSGGIWTAQPAGGVGLVTGAQRVSGPPLWSPDGSRIAYAATLPYTEPLRRSDALFLVPSAGGKPQAIDVARNAGIVPAGWWPDGQGLLFWVDPLHSASIAADGLTLETFGFGRAPTPIAQTLVDRRWVTWSRQGRLLLADGQGRPPWTRARVTVCPPAGGCVTGQPGVQPAWSPDGGRIAYISAGQLWVELADGRGAHAVAGAAAGASSPMWTADGKRLLYVRGGDVWAVSAAGGGPRRLAGGVSAVAWHP
jgi:dipeptidyl aminopeptidase/acylaminoacyl peptidase